MLFLGNAIYGKGVFTDRLITAGEILLFMAGRQLKNAELTERDAKYALQIDDDLYIGPSGLLDDYINHSCEPNCGLSMAGDEVYLVAIKDIRPWHELTFDYSTSISDGWSIQCQCHTSKCRGVVGNFSNLSDDLKRYYIENKLALPYIIRNESIQNPR
jgi:hypothetical protein